MEATEELLDTRGGEGGFRVYGLGFRVVCAQRPLASTVMPLGHGHLYTTRRFFTWWFTMLGLPY